MTDSFAQRNGWIVPVGTLYSITELSAETGTYETRRYIVSGAGAGGGAVMTPDPDNEEVGRVTGGEGGDD